MYRKEALGMLRQKLSEMGVSAVIIPTNDPHFGEYTQNYYKVREWLSGFDGSAGTLVVTLSGAALWTDSRYFIQAQNQLQGSDIDNQKSAHIRTCTGFVRFGIDFCQFFHCFQTKRCGSPAQA